MKRILRPVILNSRGEEVKLTPAEQYHAEYMERKIVRRFKNSLGYEVPITTMTQIIKKVSEQKFFQIAPADYMPVRVGQGAWSTQLTTFRSFETGDEFETGIINTGGQDAKMATAGATVDAVNVSVKNWAKKISWTIFDLEFAARSGNWDVVTALEKSRKKNWDLGVQRVAFLGARGLNNSQSGVLGLLNQQTNGVAVNTTRIVKAISAMSATELATFCQGVVEDYRVNCARTTWPTHFLVPESDHNGMATMTSPSFPIKSIKQVLEETFQTITGNKNFKILPCSYADAAYHTDVTAIAGKQVYCLYNGNEEESLRVDIPVDYTNTLANSLDDFTFANAGYGQFTGVVAYRPAEMLYFTF